MENETTILRKKTKYPESCMLNGFVGLCEDCPDKNDPDMICNEEN